MPGRFFLGVDTGENLNEHVLGDRWPPHDLRLDMLEVAITVMRQLWEGGEQTYRGFTPSKMPASILCPRSRRRSWSLQAGHLRPSSLASLAMG